LPGSFKKKFKIPSNTLAEGNYKVRFDVGIHLFKKIIDSECDLDFSLINTVGNGRRFIVDNGIRGRSSIFRPDWISF